jgi:hypothetical protein
MEGELYNPACSCRNPSVAMGDSKRSLERVLSEPLSGELGARFWGAPEPRDQRCRPFRLGHEGADRLGNRFGIDPVPAEVVPDPLVPVATVRQGFRPGAGEPSVIEVPDALELVERVVPCVLSHPGPSKTLLDVASRAFAMFERARRDLDRVLIGHAAVPGFVT